MEDGRALFGEVLDQRRLADAASPPDDPKRRLWGVPPSAEVLELLLAIDEPAWKLTDIRCRRHQVSATLSVGYHFEAQSSLASFAASALPRNGARVRSIRAGR